MKFHSATLKLSMLFAFFLLISCEERTKQENYETTPKTSDVTTETSKESNTYYAWVDNINVRDASNTKGKVIGNYTSKDALEFTGTKSDAKETIVLRGVAYNENWLRVTTKDDKEGWVFGGAVTKEGDRKGNGINTKDIFDFPHFGNFDLTTWTDLGVTNREAGDAETATYRYMKNDQVLEIENTNVGEYGYYNTYRLMNTNDEILKERKFGFQAGMGDDGTQMKLSETVKDYTSKKQYERTQMLTKHFMQLNARPEMVNGTWEENTLVVEKKVTETETALDKKIAFAKPLQIINDIETDDTIIGYKKN